MTYDQHHLPIVAKLGLSRGVRCQGGEQESLRIEQNSGVVKTTIQPLLGKVAIFSANQTSKIARWSNARPKLVVQSLDTAHCSQESSASSPGGEEVAKAFAQDGGISCWTS
jgi:hypothetical protein